MARVKRILAPTDLSQLSTLGVRYALELARDISAEVVIYFAIDLGGDWKDRYATAMRYRDMVDDTRRQLDKFLAQNFSDCIDLVEVRQLVEIGMPFKNIVETAENEKIDLIVMSTHGRTGLSHMMLGSVAEKVVARAPCPVLVVPGRGRPMRTAEAA